MRLSGSMSVNSSGHSVVAITTVFDQGPWVSMCDYIGLDTVSGKLYGASRRHERSITVMPLTHAY